MTVIDMIFTFWINFFSPINSYISYNVFGVGIGIFIANIFSIITIFYLIWFVVGVFVWIGKMLKELSF